MNVGRIKTKKWGGLWGQKRRNKFPRLKKLKDELASLGRCLKDRKRRSVRVEAQ